jgi:hypothetical protein
MQTRTGGVLTIPTPLLEGTSPALAGLSFRTLARQEIRTIAPRLCPYRSKNRRPPTEAAQKKAPLGGAEFVAVSVIGTAGDWGESVGPSSY